MKLIRYYGKARNFNSIGCVKKRENSDRNSYFFNLCSAAFTMIVFFTLGMAPQSISNQYYGKTAFFLSGTLGWNGSNTFQRKITTTKPGCFFYENRHGEHFFHTYLKLEARFWISRSSRPECSAKTVFLEILQNLQENTCARDMF